VIVLSLRPSRIATAATGRGADDDRAGPPVADRGEAPPLLRRGPDVEPVASLLEATDDAFAVLDGVVVVLGLGLRLQHRQSCPSP
jgi:hypothetical protein